MTTFTDQTPEEGYYEHYIGFFWSDKSEGPQDFTIDFQLSSEMEADFPGEEATAEYGFQQSETMREQWVVDNLQTLLDFGFVTDAYGHPEIQSVTDLKENLDRMQFTEYYY